MAIRFRRNNDGNSSTTVKRGSDGARALAFEINKVLPKAAHALSSPAALPPPKIKKVGRGRTPMPEDFIDSCIPSEGYHRPGCPDADHQCAATFGGKRCRRIRLRGSRFCVDHHHD